MKKTALIAIVLIAVALGAIISTVSESGTYASFATATSNPGKEYHVVGKLDKTRQMLYDPKVNANLFSFHMSDSEGKSLMVHFSGTKPQDFERSEQIVVVGKYSGNVFKASSILMKCPSKYNGNSTELKEVKAS